MVIENRIHYIEMQYSFRTKVLGVLSHIGRYTSLFNTSRN